MRFVVLVAAQIIIVCLTAMPTPTLGPAVIFGNSAVFLGASAVSAPPASYDLAASPAIDAAAGDGRRSQSGFTAAMGSSACCGSVAAGAVGSASDAGFAVIAAIARVVGS